MKYRLLVLVGFLFVSLAAFSQPRDNSPYSRFGIGDLTDDNFMHQRQMGGLGASYSDPYHINIVNPASYSSLRATAFDVGLYAKYASLKDPQNSSGIWSGNLEYISLAFPLKNAINELLERQETKYRLGMSFTLKANSTVGYNITSLDSIPGTGNFERNFTGSGGTYKFMWGNSIRYGNFSFGVNLGYLFGNLRYERNIVFNNLEFSYDDQFATDYGVSGFLWNMGAQYAILFNKKEIQEKKNAKIKRLTIGAYGNGPTGFSTNSAIENISTQIVGPSVIRDTASFSLDVEGKGKLPGKFGFGAIYHSGEKYAFGFNYELTKWSQYFNDAQEEELSDTYKISLGGYIRPDYKSYNNYFKRVYYRFGLYYNTDPRSIEGDRIDTYGLTFGMGMPLIYQRKVSNLNIGLNVGSRGSGTTIEEKFVRISLGFTFNDDEWFLKRKYN